jgi:hypothetical protein
VHLYTTAAAVLHPFADCVCQRTVHLAMALGHAQCGGAAHALQICSRENFVPTNFIDRWCMMGRSAVCHVCDNFDVNVRGRELEQVRTQPRPSPKDPVIVCLLTSTYFYIVLWRYTIVFVASLNSVRSHVTSTFGFYTLLLHFPTRYTSSFIRLLGRTPVHSSHCPSQLGVRQTVTAVCPSQLCVRRHICVSRLSLKPLKLSPT